MTSLRTRTTRLDVPMNTEENAIPPIDNLIGEIRELDQQYVNMRDNVFARWCQALEQIKQMLHHDLKLLEQHTAEVNRRRGEMAGLREHLNEAGVPKELDGKELSLLGRIIWLTNQREI